MSELKLKSKEILIENAIVVYERRKLIDHIFRIKLGEVDESADRIVLIYHACAVDQIVEAVKLTVGGV